MDKHRGSANKFKKIDQRDIKEYKMKKVIALLMVLMMVGGVMFAVDAGEGADLNLSSTVAGKTFHGFGTANYDTFGLILTNSGSLADHEITTLNLEGTGPQGVGFYHFASNHPSGVTVSIDAYPLTASIGDDTYYVPYTITFTKNFGTIGATDSIDVGDIANPVSTTEIFNVLTAEFVKSAISGPKWAQYGLTVLFGGAKNTEVGIPQGTYTGKVVALVTAP